MTDQTQVHALFSSVIERDLSYVDDNDDVVVEYFHGVFSTPELAQARALALAEAERAQANKELQEDGPEFATFPEVVLTWRWDAQEKPKRSAWKSDTYEYIYGATHFLVVETDVDA